MTTTYELPIQKFLRSGGTLDELLRLYAVKAKRHTEHPNLVHLKYNQIESPFAEPVVQNCRGIILDEENNWAVVCRSFDKFFNYGEGNAAVIDWATARVEEKADGSLCNVYHYKGKWHVATTGMPDALGNVVSSQITGHQTFADLFWKTFDAMGLVRGVLQPQKTYSFELMTPFNRVVVPHKESKLALLGVRDLSTDAQLPVKEWGKYLKVPTVKTFELKSWDDCIKAAATMNPMEQEGYVVVDANWNRVKMKSPPYVAIAHMKDSACSEKRVLEVVRRGESTEFLAYYPEWRPMFDEVRERFNALVSECDEAYGRIKDISVQKDFALEAVKFRWSGLLFARRKNPAITSRSYLAEVNIKHLAEALSISNDEPESQE